MTGPAEAPTNSLTLQGSDGSYALRLVVVNEGLECRGAVVVKKPSLELSPERLLAIFKEFGIRYGLVKQQCLELCYAVRQGKSCSNLLLARGTLPFPGADGYVDFAPGVYRESPDFSEAEDGSVDFRRLNVHGNVRPGQLIGTLCPATPGTDGKGVRGEVVPAAAGEPLALVVGEGARGPDARGQIHAEREGRVVFDGKMLEVSEIQLVEGDLDLETGHIDFIGFVEVRGDVPDGFQIKARRGVKITGIVGACLIESEGDVELRGMAGKGEGKILCRGNLTAHFLNDVEVECAGHVLVQNEIRNSLIKCLGLVSLPKGMITGGDCIALGGIEANKVGAPSGLRTELETGIDYRVREKLCETRDELHEVNTELSEINSILGSLKGRLESGLPLSGGEKARIAELAGKLDDRETQRQQLLNQIERLQGQDNKQANGKVNIKSLLFEGVIVAIGKARETIKAERHGPLSLIENSLDHQLRFLPMTPLTKTSRQLERELLEKSPPE